MNTPNLQDTFDKHNARVDSMSESTRWTYKHVPEGYETEQEAYQRLIMKLQEIAASHPGENVVLVSHGHIMRTFLVGQRYGTFQELAHNTLANAGYIKVEGDGKDFKIQDVRGVTKKTMGATLEQIQSNQESHE